MRSLNNRINITPAACTCSLSTTDSGGGGIIITGRRRLSRDDDRDRPGALDVTIDAAALARPLPTRRLLSRAPPAPTPLLPGADAACGSHTREPASAIAAPTPDAPATGPRPSSISRRADVSRTSSLILFVER